MKTSPLHYNNDIITLVGFRSFIMKKMPQITEAEYEVMQIIWHNYPISTNEITEQLLQTTNWNPRTIQTLIKRLATKNIITYEKQGRVFVYTPLLKKEDYVSQQSKSFLDKFFNGNLSSMVSTFLDHRNLSKAEIDELKSLLEQENKE